MGYRERSLLSTLWGETIHYK
jgi:hypothetical protein